ncbi:MAG TPA: GNAT family N-acetyltransferase [Solirubrobacteraceae bacterium]
MRAATRTTTTDPAAAALRERAIARRHAAHRAICDRIEPWEHGTLVAAGRFPTFWDYNALRVEGPPPTSLTGEDLARAADRLQAGLAHRKVEIEDEAAGAALRPSLDALGWRTERLAFMHHAGGDAGPTSPRVREVPGEAVLALRREWLGEEALDPDHAAVDTEVARLLPGELLTLAAHDAAGEPAAYAALRIAGAEGEVEDVYCTPSQRGRGLATALVAAAIARARGAGVEELWIVADDDDWPKKLYARLGFRTVWLRHDAVRRPAP